MHDTATVVDVPFDTAKLDAAMIAAGLDLVLATSRHNLRYLLGGYENYFFAIEPSLSTSRYQPALGYPLGGVARAFFVGNPLDRDTMRARPIWPEHLYLSTVDTRGSAQAVAAALVELGLERSRIGLEPAFLPADAYLTLRDALPGAELIDASDLLEELRAIKRPDELERMRSGSARVVSAMLAVFAQVEVGMTSADLARRLATEQQARGLHFDYCHVAIGSDVNRAPAAGRVREGSTICLDSGADVDGYIADLARMACVGEPTPAQRRALADVDAIQQAAIGAIRPGNPGGAVFEAAERALRGTEHAALTTFLPHGVGLVNHEAPRVAPPHANPHGYPPSHVNRELEPGMVLSIETSLAHPQLGFIKLEDTLAVTETGSELFGPAARDWTVIA